MILNDHFTLTGGKEIIQTFRAPGPMVVVFMNFKLERALPSENRRNHPPILGLIVFTSSSLQREIL